LLDVLVLNLKSGVWNYILLFMNVFLK
jgi:hypothetical protein